MASVWIKLSLIFEFRLPSFHSKMLLTNAHHNYARLVKINSDQLRYELSGIFMHFSTLNYPG